MKRLTEEQKEVLFEVAAVAVATLFFFAATGVLIAVVHAIWRAL